MVRDYTLLNKVLSIGAFSSFIFSSFLVIVSLQSQETVALAPPWGDAMEAGPGMWKNYSNGRGTEWQWGIPQNAGPNSTHSGQSAWGTNIDSNYSAEALAYLESPHFDLTLSTNMKLTFWHYLVTNDQLTHNWDGGIIEVSTDGGNTWVQIDDEIAPNPDPYYDATLRDTRGNILGGKNAYCYDQLNWTEVSVDFSQYDGSSSFKFRFAFGSDMVGDFPGWYVDDVMLSADTREGVLVEPDYSRIDHSGTKHQFNLTVRNLQKTSDIVDISVSDLFDWPVELFKWDGVSPLEDSGGLPGIPDSGQLFRGSSLDFVLKATIPVGTPYAMENIIRVEGIPFQGQVGSDTAHILLSTPSPDVAITDFLVPDVHISGERADITVFVENLGHFPRSFDVRLDIHGPGRVSYDPLKTVEDLDVGNTTNVSWTFRPDVTGDYTLSVETLLNEDTVQENNVSVKEMKVMAMVFEDDMETGGPASRGEWTPGKRPQNAWELGAPAAVGPSECHSSSRCWGTNLNSEYKKGADIRLETPLIDLSKSEEARLSFWHFYDIHGPNWNDGGFVEVSTDGGSSWTYIGPFGGYPGSVDLSAPSPPGGGAGAYAGSSLGWELAQFNLSSFSGHQVVIGFHLWSDYSNYQSGWAGWYIDDVQILQIPVGSDLIFTEIQDSGTGGERIEVYNAGMESDNLNYFAISKDKGETTITGSWSSTRIDPGDHSFFTTTGNELDDEGDLLYLVNTTSNWIERQISYGQQGVVPDPISGESSSRIWGGTEYEERWTRSPVTSFGNRNNVPPWITQTEVVLNEILFNPQNAGEEFVEILYTGSDFVNITGFIVVCDNAYTIDAGVILNPIMNHYVLLPSDYPELFAEMDANGENLYFYNSTGYFLDMVGWSSEHGVGKSVARVPEGFGSHEGYDDLSSLEAGWRFDQYPTMALIKIWPDQTGSGDLGDRIDYKVTLLNQPTDDLISLTVERDHPWQVEFYSEDWFPLTDTNSDGLVDTGLLNASSFFNFTVCVTVPTQPPIGNEMVAEVWADSAINKARDSTILVTRTFPHLEPMKSAHPEEIYLEGVGTNEVTDVTLEVFGGGYAFTDRQPQDTIFIIDSSGSMVTSDPSNLRLEATKKYVDSMREPDRGAVVDFDDTAGLAPKGSGDHLSSDYAKIKQNIDSIDSSGGTDVGAGLEVANSELIGYGNPSRLWIEILLTDGNEPDTYYPSTSMQVQNATDAGIMIFTIGLGPDANTALLGEIANRTGGEYYHAENAEALEEIYTKIELVVFDIAGRDSDLTDANRMIRDVIPSHIHVIYSSFSIHPDVIYSDMGVTFFEWNVARIRVNESWKTSYQVTCSQLGWVPVGVYPESRVSYIRWNNEEAIHPFPDTKVHCVLPPTGPPIAPPKNLRTSVQNDVDIRLDWDPPSSPTISHYLIYRSQHQRDFDFANPIHSTSGDPNPTRTYWTDLGAADPSAPREYYYVVRVMDTNGSISTTSNTAGKWTKAFATGRDSFSLPLEPFYPINVSQLANGIPNTEFIRWAGTDGSWVTHNAGMGPGVNDSATLVGRGYEISLSSATHYTFTGLPGSMISYHEGFGDSIPFREGLTADVQGTDITLTWEPLPGASEYEIYRSTKRDGLFDEGVHPIETVPATFNNYTDIGIALRDRQFYYWIIPVDFGERRGSSTYSIGVWIEGYQLGSDTLALPLKLPVEIWVDDLCELDSNIVGIVHMMKGYWRLHAREMPARVYDSVVEQSVGYQILTEGWTQLVFIGY